MFTFTTFPSQQPDAAGDTTRHFPDDDELAMEVDDDEDDELGLGGLRAKLTSPGEPLTSSQAFMRYDWPACSSVATGDDHLTISFVLYCLL